jgi:lambda family phage minor tail protein L
MEQSERPDGVIRSEISSLEPSTLIILYELVLTGHNASYYFHSGENGFTQSIIFGGKEYYYIPVQAEGFDFTESQLARPSLTFDNTDSFFSLKTRFFKDFIDFPLKRTRTFLKFLSDDNFPGGFNPFGTGTELSFPTESYVINKKTVENQNVIQFELASPLEKEHSFVPNRKVVFNTCQWRYRSSVGCGYTGAPVSDSKGNEITHNGTAVEEYNNNSSYNTGDAVKVSAAVNSQNVDQVFVCLADNTTSKHPSTNRDVWVLDACPKNIKGCRQRFGDTENTNGLPFGGFPGSWKQ